MKNILYLFSTASILLLLNCSGTEDPYTPSNTGSNNPDTPWSIPVESVFDGGPGKDGIPSVDNPNFDVATEIDFLNDEDLVIAIHSESEIRAYPHVILDWHEIVNDRIVNTSISITYCPLTGTGIGWDRIINGVETTFGVSGLLFNTNLIPYDRATDSNWSQLKHECVNGEKIGDEIKTHHLVEMSFGTFKEMYPSGLVMNTSTSYDRDYGNYPYGSYRTNEQLIFPIDNSDDRLPLKERVLGIVKDDLANAYRFSRFPGTKISLFSEVFNSDPIIVIGSTERNFMTAYHSRLSDGTELTFSIIENQFPSVMEDNEGNKWDVFGVAVEGPRTGAKLRSPLNYIGYWFAWATFNPNIELIE